MNDLKLVFRSPKGRCRGNQFCGLNPGTIHRIRFAWHSLDGGVRQEVQVLRWTETNQLPDSKDAGEPVKLAGGKVNSRAGYNQPCNWFSC